MGRLLAVGDIHGQCAAFTELLIHAGYKPGEDTLVLTGDLINRGPYSAQMVDWCIEAQKQGHDVRVVMGNHEYMFIGYAGGQISEEDYFSPSVGGKPTLDSYKGYDEDQVIEHLQWMARCPFCIEIGDYVFTHAGLNVNKPLSEQDSNDTVWDETAFHAHYTGYPDKTVVFGHYSVINLNLHYPRGNKDPRRAWHHKKFRMIGIDGHGKTGGELICLDLTNNKEYHYNFKTDEREVYEFC